MRRFVSHISNKELDRDLELNYFGARYYQPEFPRFLSPDPVGGSPEVPISWNRYLYCRNDPVNMIDPDGRLTVVLLPYQEVVGDIKLVKHASVYVDSDNYGESRLYDPAGGFNSENRGSDDSLYDDNADIGEYIKFHQQDNDKVAVFVFDTTPEEEAQIGENADQVGGAVPGLCAVSVGNVLQGIGPFENLGATLTPAMLFRALIGLQISQTQEEVTSDEPETE